MTHACEEPEWSPLAAVRQPGACSSDRDMEPRRPAEPWLLAKGRLHAALGI